MTKILTYNNKAIILDGDMAIEAVEGGGSFIVITTNKKLATLTCGEQTYTLTGDELSHNFAVTAGTYVCTATLGTATASSTVIVTENDVYYTELIISAVPAEYQQVEYISNTNTSAGGYVSLPATNIKLGDFYFELNAYTTGGDSYGWMCGTPFTSPASGSFGYASSQGRIYIAGQSLVGGVKNKDFILKLDALSFELTYDDVTQTGSYPSPTPEMLLATNNSNIIIFGATGLASVNFAQGRLYSVKVKNGDVTVYNVLPVYRKSDNVVGVYDTEGETFYPTLGTGVFIAGPDVN